MDPFSAVASAIAVVQIADRIITLCKDYITGVHDAPADLRAILIEVGSVKCVLEVIELLNPSSGGDDKVEILEKLRSPIEGCQEALKGLEALFPSQQSSTTRSRRKKQKVALCLATLAWPFKRDKALKLLEEIGRHKSTIALGLTADSAIDLKFIRRNVEQIREATNESEMHQILKWLVKIDPSPNHNNACRLYEEHTGQWLTNSSEYADWKAGRSPFLWLHGIPGAGKTILLSYITEDVKRSCQETQSEHVAWAYYYCYFGHGPVQTESFLRWIIRELCKQIAGIPSEVRALFKTGHEPRMNELLSVLSAVVKNFSRVYITIDALDEATDRSDREMMLTALRDIIKDGRHDRIQLLVTSRKELEIERALLPLGSNLSLSNPYVDEDIRIYVRNRMQEEPRFRRWPDQLRDEIESALVKGAKGMFRWAFCQLDILKRLNTAPEIRMALTQLPETLDETYERILCSIPSEQQNMVFRTLSLVAVDLDDDCLTLNDLSDLLAVNLENPSFERQNRPLDPYAPVEACTCLLTYNDDDDELMFAHYTVKEFLLSSRIRSGPANFFQMIDDSILCLATSCFIVYLLYEDYDNPNENLMRTASKWHIYVDRIEPQSLKNDLAPLIIQLLDSTQPHFRGMKKTLREDYLYEDLFSPIASGFKMPTILANLCLFDQIDVAGILLASETKPICFETLRIWDTHPDLKKFLSISRDGEDDASLEDASLEDDVAREPEKALSEILKGSETGFEILSISQVALTRLDILFLELFLSQGADANAVSFTGFSLLATAVSSRPLPCGQYWGREWSGRSELVEILLAHKADPSKTKCTITPLQSLIEGIKFESFEEKNSVLDILGILRKLLDAGARVNGVGCDAINVERIRTTAHLYFQKSASQSLCLDPEKEEEVITVALHNRGQSLFYDTPLRILENTKKSLSDKGAVSAWELASFDRVEELLKSYGAKSFHLFPVKDLPGYDEDDMEEWQKLNELQDMTASSSSSSEPLK